MNTFQLNYDHGKYTELVPNPENTLQLFITNRCNKRCTACFYAHNLGKDDMNLLTYCKHIETYLEQIQKVILLGGEPTLHAYLMDMIWFNYSNGLNTTVYSNGIKLRGITAIPPRTTFRIGVYGAYTSEKPLSDVEITDLPVTIVYMLRNDNIQDLPIVAKMAENYNCRNFYISSIRDIAQTNSFWIDNEDTIPLDKYYQIVQDFIDTYEGNLTLHIATRGVIEAKESVSGCRFGNIFPDGQKIICPFDISKQLYTHELNYGRKCNKNKECILTKLVLQPIKHIS